MRKRTKKKSKNAFFEKRRYFDNLSELKRQKSRKGGATMETIVDTIVNSGGYAALCVLLVFQLRECNQVVRDNTAAISGLLEHLKGGGA